MRPGNKPDGSGPDREFLYRDHRLFAIRRGTGWRVFIHVPGSALAYEEVPGTNDPAGLDHVVTEAQRLVDKLLSYAADRRRP